MNPICSMAAALMLSICTLDAQQPKPPTPAAVPGNGDMQPKPATVSTSKPGAKGFFPGVNIYAGEFTVKWGYFPPTESEFEYFKNKGFKLIRLPFRWEMIQPEVNGELNPELLKELDRCVGLANKFDMVLLLDVHNFGERPIHPQNTDKNAKLPLVGVDPTLPNSTFVDLWVKLANRYKDNERVWFGLMNEPHKSPPQTPKVVAETMQLTVKAIRKTGAKNKILIPGACWDAAWSWVKCGNAAAYDNFQDPGNNFAFEVHNYLDKDSSGTHTEAVPEGGKARLTEFTAWLKKHHWQGFLGEFGWDNNPANTQANVIGDEMLAYMDQNRDVWLGYAYWAAGRKWRPTYMYLLHPENLDNGAPVDKNQMQILIKHL